MYLVRLLLTFVLYCFMGWILESTFHLIWERKPVNRGFLNGPYIPIYGFGAIIAILVLEPFKDYWYLVFIISIVLATTLEYFVGWAMERIFHNRWWDYSGYPLNLHGRISLFFSIGWGLLCLILIYIVHPLVASYISMLSPLTSIILVTIIAIIMLTDLVFTVKATINLNATMHRLEQLSLQAKRIRTEISDGLHERKLILVKTLVIWRAQARQLNYIQKRLLRAFPRMKSLKHQETLNNLKHWANKQRQRLIFPKTKIPSLSAIINSLELPAIPPLRNPFAHTRNKKRRKKHF